MWTAIGGRVLVRDDGAWVEKRRERSWFRAAQWFAYRPNGDQLVDAASALPIWWSMPDGACQMADDLIPFDRKTALQRAVLIGQSLHSAPNPADGLIDIVTGARCSTCKSIYDLEGEALSCYQQGQAPVLEPGTIFTLLFGEPFQHLLGILGPAQDVVGESIHRRAYSVLYCRPGITVGGPEIQWLTQRDGIRFPPQYVGSTAYGPLAEALRDEGLEPQPWKGT